MPSLSYIWSVTGIEGGQFIMVFSQDGDDHAVQFSIQIPIGNGGSGLS
ncbi:MAG: hypothetical protein M0Q43_06650 [Methanothrix sp.]|nr:hypothetical protein [Methanothrix sp.]